MTIDYVISVSGGNDSTALVQWSIERGLTNVHCVYVDTGWSAPDWPDRVAAILDYARSHGFGATTIESEGLPNLVRRKKAWPMCGGRMQFCSGELKVRPIQRWLDTVDPDAHATMMLGIRREESRHRATHPEIVPDADRAGGRDIWCPLVRHLAPERDELIRRAGFDVLPTRSRDCWPCICSNRAQIAALSQDRVDEISRLEHELPRNRDGSLRAMFRPYRIQGAVGIHSAHLWAQQRHGQFARLYPHLIGRESYPCASGLCVD